jgi:uncharacterized protein YigE (DUF2233 family)
MRTRIWSVIRVIFASSLVLLCSACGGDTASKPAAEGKIIDSKLVAGTCRAAIFEGSEFTRCTAVPGKQVLNMKLSGSNGLPLRSLRKLENSLSKSAVPVAFAMNAGMYDDDGRPIGYYVENGKRLKTLNQKKGGGNFHLLPNGVFFGDDSKWQISTSKDFSDNVTKRPHFASQSGPMLVIDGKFHPEISANGSSINIRNSVGVDLHGRAHFVISEVPVSFGRLARFMRDELGCANALYFDGTVSSLWYPAGDRQDNSYPLGPLIVATNAVKESQ